MKRIYLWLLKRRAAELEELARHFELSLQDARARLEQAHREVRLVKAELATRTPARKLLAEMERAKLASRQRNVYR